MFDICGIGCRTLGATHSGASKTSATTSTFNIDILRGIWAPRPFSDATASPARRLTSTVTFDLDIDRGIRAPRPTGDATASPDDINVNNLLLRLPNLTSALHMLFWYVG